MPNCHQICPHLKFPFSWLRPSPAACRLFILNINFSLLCKIPYTVVVGSPSSREAHQIDFFYGTVEMINALVQRLLHLCLVDWTFLFLTTSNLLKPFAPFSDTSPQWRILSIPCREITLNWCVGSRLNEPFDALSFLLWSRYYLLH